MGLTEIAQKAGLPKATAYRLLRALEEESFVQQTADHRYQLGTLLLTLGRAVLDRLELSEVARPFLAELREAVQETVHLGVLQGADVVYVDKVLGPHAIQMYSRIGRRVPAYCGALGKSLLAHIPEEQLEEKLETVEFVKRGPNTVTSKAALLELLAEVRRQGYAVDDEETEAGVRCVGAPIFDHTGSVVAAVSVTGTTARISPGDVPDLAAKVIESANAISKALGFAGPPAAHQPA